MHVSARRGIAFIVLAWALTGLVVVPTFAVSDVFQVDANKKHIHSGDDLKVTGTLKHANPNCDYAVTFSVSGPGGSWSASDSVTTSPKGSGHVDAKFPNDFPGANSDTDGTYTVTGTFSCGYSTASASDTFDIKDKKDK
jgi:hypothetical protein